MTDKDLEQEKRQIREITDIIHKHFRDIVPGATTNLGDSLTVNQTSESCARAIIDADLLAKPDFYPFTVVEEAYIKNAIKKHYGPSVVCDSILSKLGKPIFITPETPQTTTEWDGETCHICTREQRLAWSVSDDIWESVMGDYKQVVCLECFLHNAAIKGISVGDNIKIQGVVTVETHQMEQVIDPQHPNIGFMLPKETSQTNKDDERVYPCARCGKLRSKNEGGTTFTLCDKCWEAIMGRKEPQREIHPVTLEIEAQCEAEALTPETEGGLVKLTKRDFD